MGGTKKRCLGGTKLNANIALSENFGNKKTKIKMYQPEDAHKMLGVHTDPAGTLSKQIRYMESQAREWNNRMVGSTLQSASKLLSFNNELAPRLRYPIPTVPLTKTDCKQIMKPALVSI